MIGGSKRVLYRSQLGYAFLAISGGLVGGFLYGSFRAPSASADEPRLIRAKAVEVVDSSGRRIGYWGSTANGAVLSVLDRGGKERAEFGVAASGLPVLRLNGADGNPLVSLELRPSGKPLLVMSEPAFHGRVILGTNEPDAPARQAENDAWVLQFQGNGRPFATIGMRATRSGGVAVRDKDGNEWRAPLPPSRR